MAIITDVLKELRTTTFKDLGSFTKAYRRGALQLHPDKHAGQSEKLQKLAEMKFKKLVKIFEKGVLWFKTHQGSFCYTKTSIFMFGSWAEFSAQKKPKLYPGKDLPPRAEVPYWLHPKFPKIATRAAALVKHELTVAELSSAATKARRLQLHYKRWMEQGFDTKVEHADWDACASKILSGYYFTMESDGLYYFPGKIAKEDMVEVKFVGTPGDSAMFTRWFDDNESDPAPDKPSGCKIHTAEEFEQAVKEAREIVEDELKRNTSERFAKMQETIDSLEKSKSMEIDEKEKNKIDLTPVGYLEMKSLSDAKTQQELLTKVYNFFDSLDVDKKGNFSLKDAYCAAYQLEHPDANIEEVDAFAAKAFRNARSKRKHENSSAAKGSKVFVSYPELIRLLMLSVELSRFAHIISSLAAREIAPSQSSIAALMLHLTDISHNSLNINVAFSVLGLGSQKEKKAYLNDLCIFTADKISCMEALAVKKGGICGSKVMRCKTVCSYHFRRMK
jgi:curved DNA-binding protein CbpA